MFLFYFTAYDVHKIPVKYIVFVYNSLFIYFFILEIERCSINICFKISKFVLKPRSICLKTIKRFKNIIKHLNTSKFHLLIIILLNSFNSVLLKRLFFRLSQKYKNYTLKLRNKLLTRHRQPISRWINQNWFKNFWTAALKIIILTFRYSPYVYTAHRSNAYNLRAALYKALNWYFWQN